MKLPRLNHRQIIELRPSANRPQPSEKPLGFEWEREPGGRSADQQKIVDVLTVFLIGGECQFRCAMCDLWKFTHVEATRPGAIPGQLQYVLQRCGLQERQPRWIKLYNASNFFSEVNVPKSDLKEIADLLRPFERVIVENHPLLNNRRLFEFSECIFGKLEIAMGLETIHPDVLPALNKQMTIADFGRACRQLSRQDIDVRSFVLLRPPGLNEQEAIDWCSRSVNFATNTGVRHVSIIPLRAGNGTIEHFEGLGLCELPLASSLEHVLAENIGHDRTIVTADLWDWDHLRGKCQACSQPRKQRLHEMNLQQCILPPVKSDCHCCDF